ncbi:MAG: efflux RND transporter periplasmic adaptor subunit [Planctomycetota bacterium]|nr:MAG: efflux RND transporter periplasmic adaptor subunit [Planctomycetota bacterium]
MALTKAFTLSSLLVSLGLLTAGCDIRAEARPEKGHVAHSDAASEGHGEKDAEHGGAAEHGEHAQKIVVTRPKRKDVTYSEPFVCQIRARQHIEIRALVEGYLQDILVNEGQLVKKGEVMFRILPVVYQAHLNKALAEAKLAEIELANTRRLYEKKAVSIQEVKIFEAKLAKAQAEVQLAQAELKFTEIRAPFEGLVDKLEQFPGALLEKDDVLTKLTDNSVMWVYFNVPEARYLAYMAGLKRENEKRTIELVLANGKKYPYTGKIAAIEAAFNNETGNIAFRADFPNPDRLLRHGQTGKVLITRDVKDAIIIPQRAVFNILEKRFVYVVDDHNVVHQREVKVQYELEDIFVIDKGVDESDKIVLEGVLQVRDGDHIEYEYQDPDEVLKHLKFHAE